MNATLARKTDYKAARIALGMTPEEADAATHRARVLGKRIARQEITFQRAHEILELRTVEAMAKRRVRERRAS